MSQNGQTHFKILLQMLQDFQSVSGHFGTLHIKGLKLIRKTTFLTQIYKKEYWALLKFC